MNAAAPLVRWRATLLIAVTVVFAAAAILISAAPQPLSYHAFADSRTIWAIPNFFNVFSNALFLVGGAMGILFIARRQAVFIDAREQLPYVVFFLGALLTAFGSSWYHLAPDNARLVWDRLPMTLGFSGLVSAALVERASPEIGLRALWPLLGLGIASVLYWSAGERAGEGNVIPYAVYQGWSIVIIVLLIAAFPARRHTHGALLAWAAAAYGLAKVCETFDVAIYRSSGQTVSGHTVKHILAASAVVAIAMQLRRRESLQEGTPLPRIAPPA